MFRKINVPLSVKAVGDSGTFEGYGSVFDVVDSYSDRVKKGAFLKSLATYEQKGTLPALLWQHQHDNPIGIYTEMKEDDRGLFVKGKFALDTQLGKEAHALMSMGALTGLSIGYGIAEDGITANDDGTYDLTEIDLWEVSPVTFPANDESRIVDVKSMTRTNFESEVRNALGLSQREAKRLLAGGWPALVRNEQDNSDTLDAIKSLTEKISRSF